MRTVFSFLDYRQYLRFRLELAEKTRGYHKELADAAGCKSSYLSQILHSNVQMTLDQAARLASFWEFSVPETDYFVDLVQLERCASVELKKICSRRLNRLKDSQLKLSERLSSEQKMPFENQLAYFSRTLVSIVHNATRIREYSDPDAIAKRFGLPLNLVRNTLEQLKGLGMVQESNGRWKPTTRILHVGGESPLAWINHTNWRNEVISRFNRGQYDGVHYTSIYSLSKKDALLLREEIVDFIERTRRIVVPSENETLTSFQLDFWEI